MTAAPKVLVPFDRNEAITINLAATLAGMTPQTVRNWCEAHQIGRKIADGQWRVSRPALLMLLDGDRAALRQYLAGERGGIVREYFDRVQKNQK